MRSPEPPGCGRVESKGPRCYALAFTAAFSPLGPGQGLGAGEAATGRPRPKAALPPLHLLLAPSWWAMQGRAAPSFRTQNLTAVLKVFPRPEKLVFQGNDTNREIHFNDYLVNSKVQNHSGSGKSNLEFRFGGRGAGRMGAKQGTHRFF